MWLVDELRPPRCEQCGAPVARALMGFHRDWHATQMGGGREFLETTSAPSVDQMLKLVAALKALPPVVARPEYVADLRARLVAEASSGRDAGVRTFDEAHGALDCVSE